MRLLRRSVCISISLSSSLIVHAARLSARINFYSECINALAVQGEDSEPVVGRADHVWLQVDHDTERVVPLFGPSAGQVTLNPGEVLDSGASALA
jgi:hypothetical protein